MKIHGNGIYYELHAKSTLEILFPNEFTNLKLSDKPDLTDNNAELGIEITRPINQHDEMFDSFYREHLYDKTKDELPVKGLKKFTDSGRELIFDSENNKVSGYKMPCEPFDIEIIFKAIELKNKKLNLGFYGRIKNIYLYLETCCYSCDTSNYETATQILNYALNLKNNNMYFKEIIYDCFGVLYRINVETKSIDEYDLIGLLDAIENRYNENLCNYKLNN